MSKSKKKPASSSGSIAQNKKARHDYIIDKKFEAGLVLMGWEVKSLREGKIQLRESYITLDKGEAWLTGAHISPLNTASTHVICNPVRARKLLLHGKEISNLAAQVAQDSYTIVCTAMYWKGNKVKCEIALAKGKKQHDKRATMKERDWNRDKARVLKAH